MKYQLGWIPDIPDRRELLYAAQAVPRRRLPQKVDLRDQFTQPPNDQGQAGSSTANAVAAANEFDRIKERILRNSWGSEWGSGDYGTRPYEYLADRRLSQDFWTIRTTSHCPGGNA